MNTSDTRFSLTSIGFRALRSHLPLGTLVWRFRLVSLALHSCSHFPAHASRFVRVFPLRIGASRFALVSPALYSCPSCCARVSHFALIVHCQEMLQVIFNHCVSSSKCYISSQTALYKLYLFVYIKVMSFVVDFLLSA